MPGRGRRLAFLALALALVLGPAACQAREPDWAAQRRAMVERQIAARGIEDPRVLAAMAAVPRHRFIPDTRRRKLAYGDHPVPIGWGQTISQPFIVAYMTSVLEVAPGQKVLEIGTGSGYQAAVLAQMGAQVYTIEIVPQLHDWAAGVLSELGYAQVQTRLGDGYAGWPAESPFARIIVTAAPESLPQALVEQLAPGGRMVLPVGPVMGVQQLILVEKDAAGKVSRRYLESVRFVPMVKGE